MQETIGEMITTIIHNEDNTKTFEVRREFKGVGDGKAFKIEALQMLNILFEKNIKFF